MKPEHFDSWQWQRGDRVVLKDGGIHVARVVDFISRSVGIVYIGSHGTVKISHRNIKFISRKNMPSFFIQAGEELCFVDCTETMELALTKIGYQMLDEQQLAAKLKHWKLDHMTNGIKAFVNKENASGMSLVEFLSKDSALQTYCLLKIKP